jgi:hypothetical protein
MNKPIDEYEKNFEITVEDDWVRIRVMPDSVVTSDLILSILKKLYSLEAYRSEKVAGLWDFRGCRSDLNYEQIEQIEKYIDLKYDSSWSHKYTAIVADEDLIFGLSRTYEMMTDNVPTITNVFRDMDEAQKWLKESSK